MGQLVERRIGVVGRSSFVIVLPKGWLRYHGLQAGDTVQVVTNGVLTVLPMPRPPDTTSQAETRTTE